MKKSIVAPLIGAFMVNFGFAAEKSVFLAGDINSPTPYGLTDTEKVMLKNSNELKSNVGMVSNKVGTLEEQLDGVRSVLDGTSERMNNIDKRLKALEGTYGEDSNVTQLPTKLEDLRSYIAKNRQIQDKNNKKVKKILKELSSLIDSINSNYVTKNEYNELLKRVDALDSKNTHTVNSKTKSSVSNPKNNLKKNSKLSGKKLHSLAKKAFDEKKYNDAKYYYELSATKNYKPALSNYMLGEVEYNLKNYVGAIPYYKVSAELYDKADYMPRLLYHTAISFDKIGDTQSANRFYKAIKANYPKTKEAKASPSR